MASILDFIRGRNLVKPAVVDPNAGTMTLADNPQELLDEYKRGLGNVRAAEFSTPINDSVPLLPEPGAQAQPQPEPPKQEFVESTPASTEGPRIVRPKFAQVAIDRNGNVQQGPTPGLTKLGVLAKVLTGSLRGAMDAAANGALDAVPGRSNFGFGLQAAQQMPLVRAEQASKQRQQALQEKQAQATAAVMPWFLRNQQEKAAADLANTQAETAYKTAQANRPESIDEQLGSAVASAVNSGRDPLSDERVKQLTNVKVSLLRQPQDQTSPDAIWYRAFKNENKREPNTQEVLGYLRTKAQNTHISLRDSASDSDINEAAKQLVNPRNLTALKDVASLRGDQRLKILSAAKKLDPNFDPGITNERIRFLQSYEDPKGRAAINRQAINNILQHGGDLRDLNDKYRARTEFRPLNTPINKIAQMFGSTAYTEFATVNSVLKDELALYFAGGYAPTQDQQSMWNKIQSDEATPAQTEAFTREVARLAFRRANTFNGQFKKVMGYDDPSMLIPEAVNAAQKLGLSEEVKKYGSGGGYGVQPAQQQTPRDSFDSEVNAAGGFVLQ